MSRRAWAAFATVVILWGVPYLVAGQGFESPDEHREGDDGSIGCSLEVVRVDPVPGPGAPSHR